MFCKVQVLENPSVVKSQFCKAQVLHNPSFTTNCGLAVPSFLTNQSMMRCLAKLQRGASPPLPDLIEIVFVGWGVCRLAGELMGGGAGNT